MAYIGRRPLIGNYIVLDAISPSATTTFNLTQSGSAYSPQLAQNCIVSVNGVIQAPNTSYTISGSTIVFSTALSTTDTINFITVLGDVQNVGTPTAGTVTAASFATGFNGVVTWQNVQTTNFTAVAGRGYPVNTTSAGITVTLPSSAVAGNTIQIVDYAGTAATNNITIAGNGNNVNGKSNFYLFQNREAVNVTYIDATQGWLINSGFNEGVLPNYTASYLIVAGGGGGGAGVAAIDNGGGGGAGGLLTSTTTLTPNTVYTITVGAGGSSNNNGSNSSITGLTTAIGGGSGGTNSAGGVGSSGGSGGGGGSQPGSGGSGTSGQGNTGGTGSGSASPPAYGGGGGGGSSAVGSNGSGSAGGAGGIGSVTTLITTAQATTYSVGQTSAGSVYFSGGGGGSATTTGGAGGIGGGASGGSNIAGSAGTTNTGGGGGGGANTLNSAGGAGGSGCVILSVPTVNYSGTYTGSSTYVTTNGTSTVIIFKSSGSYTG